MATGKEYPADCIKTDRLVHFRTPGRGQTPGAIQRGQRAAVIPRPGWRGQTGKTKKEAPSGAPFPTIYNHKTNSQLTKIIQLV
jgi:hypothetical protein